MRILYLTIALLMTIPAQAAGIPSGFASFSYPLPQDLTLHGWSDGTDDPLQTQGERRYAIDLSIVNEVTEITAPAAHRIVYARYRAQHSFWLSDDGKTLPLPSMTAPFSSWRALPVTSRGQSLSLAPINYFDSTALHSGDTPEDFAHLSYQQLHDATYAAGKQYNLDIAGWLRSAKQCAKYLDDSSNYCGTYVNQVELELILHDASPVRITFNYIPGC